MLDTLWQAVIAPSTRMVYSTGYNTFRRFLALSGYVQQTGIVPVTENVLVYFLAHCYSVLKLQHSTILTYFAGIRFTYLSNGFSNPLITSTGLPLYRLQMLLKAVKKVQTVHYRPRFPLDADLLRILTQSLTSGIFGPFSDRMMKAACTMAFFGFLRCGEFTALTSKFDLLIHLCVSDIVFDKDYSKFTLFLKKSKTDIFRQGVCIPLFRTNSAICPVAAMQEYIAVRTSCGSSSTDPLFVTADGAILTRAKFLHLLRDLLYRLGYNQAGFSGHSFRIGAATSASKANLHDYLIKALGRWSSDCYVRYIHTPEISLRRAQNALDTH